MDKASSSRLIIPASSLFSFPADFTVEMFVRQIAFPLAADTLLEIGSFSNGILIRPGDSLVYVNGDAVANSGSNWRPTVGSWEHLAIARQGLVTRTFRAGILRSTSTAGSLTTVNSTAAGGSIGSTRTPSGYNDCFVDEVRITKGIAWYTAAFTPPSAPFPDS
jgi:hypothetical protein